MYMLLSLYIKEVDVIWVKETGENNVIYRQKHSICVSNPSLNLSYTLLWVSCSHPQFPCLKNGSNNVAS